MTKLLNRQVIPHQPLSNTKGGVKSWNPLQKFQWIVTFKWQWMHCYFGTLFECSTHSLKAVLMEHQVGMTIFKPLQLFKIIAEMHLRILESTTSSRQLQIPHFCPPGSHLPLQGDRPLPTVKKPLHHFATNPTLWPPATVANRLRIRTYSKVKITKKNSTLGIM